MSNLFSWQRCSVQKFFGQSNWEGYQNKIDRDEIFQEISWLCLKIEEFFRHSNWQGSLLTISSPSNFSLTSPVYKFFQYFVWEGNPEIAALPKLKSIPESDSLDNNMTLDDLSDLF